jgi:hypothetical protein
VLEKKDYTTYSGEHFGKSYHTKVNTVYQW